MSATKSAVLTKFYDKFKYIGLSRRTFLLAGHTFTQSIKNKRFYIVLFYFLLPVIANLFSFVLVDSSYYSGKAYAVYQIHQALNSTLVDWWMSIFGQMFIILIASDIISSEFEKGTILALKSRSISDLDIFLGKFIGITLLSSLLVIPGAVIIYIAQIWSYAAKSFWWVFWHSLDELIASILIVMLGIILLLSVCFLFSSIFNKSLQATLVTLLVVFAVQLLSSVFAFSDNLISKFNITRYLQHFLEPVLYNIELVSSATSITYELLGFIGVIILLLAGGFVIYEQKEVH
ncbi:MAG: ABC transporter permease [Candidatus Heimdallarchaeaceae archaeon]